MRMPILAYTGCWNRSLRRIGVVKHSAGIKAAARIAKDWSSATIQGIGR
jgi:hypothetical protein